MARRLTLAACAAAFVLLLLAASGAGRAAYAQATPIPTPFAPQLTPIPTPMPQPTAVAWEAIPDIVGYVRFDVPTCDDCGGVPPALEVGTQPEPPDDGGWFGLGDWFNIDWFGWIVESVWDIVVKLTCWLLFMLRLVVDILAVICNVLLQFLNELWRLLIILWLSLSSVIIWLAGLIQYVLDILSALLIYVFWVLEFARIILIFLLELIVVVVNLVLLLIGVVLRLLALIGWLGALLLGVLDLLLTGLLQPDGSSGEIAYNTPQALTEVSGHPILLGLRGIQEGILNSRAGWMIGLLHVLAWIGFFIWIVTFLPGTKTSGEAE